MKSLYRQFELNKTVDKWLVNGNSFAQFYLKMGVLINQKRAFKLVLSITYSFWGKSRLPCACSRRL